MALLDFLTGNGVADGDSNGNLWTRLRDKFGNGIAKQQREAASANQEYLLVAGKNDNYTTALRTDRKGNVIVGNYIPELIDSFEGGTLHVQKWTPTNTTFVPVQSTIGGYNINSTNLTTINAVHILQSQRLFYKIQRIPLQDKIRLRANIFTNSVLDLGFGIPSGTTLLIPNSVCFRVVNGSWTAVITSNGVELIVANVNNFETGVQLNTANLNSNYLVSDIIMDDDNAVFTVQNTETGELIGYANVPVPFNALKMFQATALPKFIRLFNSGVAPATAPVVVIAETQTLITDVNINMDACQIAANLGMVAGRHPFTGAPLTTKTNNAGVANVTLANATANYTQLDAVFAFAAIAGSDTSDYCLIGFQVPANSKFIYEGITINSVSIGAAVATTPTLLEWSVGLNSSAVSLATTNIVRKQVGLQSFAIGDLGREANKIDITTNSGEVVESGRFVQVCLKMPVGTATASQIIRGAVNIKGRFI